MGHSRCSLPSTGRQNTEVPHPAQLCILLHAAGCTRIGRTGRAGDGRAGYPAARGRPDAVAEEAPAQRRERRPGDSERIQQCGRRCARNHALPGQRPAPHQIRASCSGRRAGQPWPPSSTATTSFSERPVSSAGSATPLLAVVRGRSQAVAGRRWTCRDASGHDHQVASRWPANLPATDAGRTESGLGHRVPQSIRRSRARQR
jgi:hypothetical protein